MIILVKNLCSLHYTFEIIWRLKATCTHILSTYITMATGVKSDIFFSIKILQTLLKNALEWMC